MATILIPTKNLHPYIKQLIKELRAGSGKHAPGSAVIDSADFVSSKPRRFSPREVRLEFQAGKQVRVNVQAFSLNAVNGREVSRGEPLTHMGSDGEPNYETTVTYEGPVVAHYGYSQRDARVVVMIPTGVGDSKAEYGTQAYEDAWESTNEAAGFYQKLADKKDWAAFVPMVDAALEGVKIPYAVSEQGKQRRAQRAEFSKVVNSDQFKAEV